MFSKILKIIALLGIMLLTCSVLVVCKELFTTLDIEIIGKSFFVGMMGLILVAIGGANS